MSKDVDDGKIVALDSTGWFDSGGQRTAVTRIAGGVAFDGRGGVVVCSNDTAYRLPALPA